MTLLLQVDVDVDEFSNQWLQAAEVIKGNESAKTQRDILKVVLKNFIRK